MRVKIDPLDTLCSEYVRRRAMQRCGGCERCHHKKSSYNELQCAHFHGRRKKSVRYDPDNCAGLCFGCHQHLDSNPLEKIEFFRKLLGKEKFEHLNIRASIPQKPDKEAIKIYLKQQIKSIS